MSGQSKEKFVELKEAVSKSAEHTKRQIDSIDSFYYLSGLLSLIAVIGVSYLLNIFIYWIPAGFVILYLWSLKGFTNVQKPFHQSKVEQALIMYEKVNESQIVQGVEWFFRNLDPFVKSVAIIYSISMFIILAISSGWIAVSKSFNPIIPLITCIIYVITPFTMDNLVNFFRRRKFVTIISDLKKKGSMSILIALAGLLFTLVYSVIIVLFPFVSIIMTLHLIEDWLFFVLVIVLQIVVLLSFLHFFTAQSAKKELINSLTNFADIDYQISNAILNNVTNDAEFERLKLMYLTAKPYDLKIDSSMKFVDLYTLLMHRVHMSSIPEIEKYNKNLQEGNK